MSTKNLRTVRNSLFEKDPHCCYCGCVVILPETVAEQRECTTATIGTPPDDMATVEHRYTRLDPRRYEPQPEGESRYLLACYRCNHDKGNRDQEEIPVEFRQLPIEERLIEMGQHNEAKRVMRDKGLLMSESNRKWTVMVHKSFSDARGWTIVGHSSNPDFPPGKPAETVTGRGDTMREAMGDLRGRVSEDTFDAIYNEIHK